MQSPPQKIHSDDFDDHAPFISWIIKFFLAIIVGWFSWTSLAWVDLALQSSSLQWVVLQWKIQHSTQEETANWSPHDRAIWEEWKEMEALKHYVQESTGVNLSHVRIFLFDRGHSQVTGLYNPWFNTLKVSFRGTGSKTSPFRQRWTVLHELGHAVADATERSSLFVEGQDMSDEERSQWSLDRTQRYNIELQWRDNPLVQSMYGESFADVFAVALGLALEPEDPEVFARLMRSLHNKDPRAWSLSLIHDTQESLQIALRRLDWIKKLKGRDLLGAIDGVASLGTLQTIHSWGAYSEIDRYQSSFYYWLSLASKKHILWTDPMSFPVDVQWGKFNEYRKDLPVGWKILLMRQWISHPEQLTLVQSQWRQILLSQIH